MTDTPTPAERRGRHTYQAIVPQGACCHPDCNDIWNIDGTHPDNDFCHHCGGGPLLICSFCGPQRIPIIDPGDKPVSEHLTPFESDRGFLYMPEIAGKHPGSRIEVHQSSSAEGPHVWVGADDGETVVLVHLPAEQARQFAEQVLWLLAPAAEPVRPVRDVLADAMCRHRMTGDWYEKADEVLADLHAAGWRLTNGKER